MSGNALSSFRDALELMALLILALIIDAIVYIHCGLLHLIKGEPFRLCVNDSEDVDFIEDFDPYVYNE